MGLLDWVDPTREWFKGRPEAVKGLLGAAYQMATDPQAREAAMARYPVFDRSQSGQQMMDNALNAGPSGLLGKIVWHGSPHKFDKFDASKIGTGEGAQAYGHGVYLADKSGVAKDYANTLGTMEWKRAGAEANYDPMTLDLIKRELQKGQSVDDVLAMYKQYADAASPSVMKDMHNALKSGDVGFGGALYKADLPDEWIPKMLDWDKPISQQPKEVVDGFRQMLKDQKYLGPNDNGPRQLNAALKAWKMERAGMSEKDSGNLFWQAVNDSVGSPDKAAEYFRNAGIPGIRYLDGGSRSAGQGSYNYVVFPGLEDKVKILERNGVPLGLLGAMP